MSLPFLCIWYVLHMKVRYADERTALVEIEIEIVEISNHYE